MSIALSIEQFVPRLPEYRGEQPISLSIDKGENGALIGPNGAGKTLITDIIQGKLLPREGRLTLTADSEKPHYQLIKSMSFRDIYSLTDCREMYYQQRWNSFNQEEVPIVRSLLKNIPEEKIEQYASFFHIEELLDKRIISLSSGELRKFLITKTLMSEPELLILDNPFIGLDAQSRESLNQLCNRWCISTDYRYC